MQNTKELSDGTIYLMSPYGWRRITPRKDSSKMAMSLARKKKKSWRNKVDAGETNIK